MPTTPEPAPGRDAARPGRPATAGTVVAALAAAVLAGGGLLWATRPSDARQPAYPMQQPVTTEPTTRPEREPTGTQPVTQPVARPAGPRPVATAAPPDRLTIRRLGIDLSVVPVGVARNGEMALPPTPAEVGWYRFGSRPGDPAGASVLAAHLDMPGYGIGPIAGVTGLRPGDVIEVRSGATTRRYAVTSVESVRKTALDLPRLFDRDGAPVLHVVTCGGDFDRKRRSYDENVVVTARPAS